MSSLDSCRCCCGGSKLLQLCKLSTVKLDAWKNKLMRKDEQKGNVFVMKLLLCFIASKFLLREQQHRMQLKDEDKENARTYVSEALALCSHGAARIRL
jgi:hypothetical protein